MRLSNNQLSIIIQAFSAVFCNGDSLWLFGSRADASKKGGDIDLLVMTEDLNNTTVMNRKRAFFKELQEKLGEQKIDIVLQQPNSDLGQVIFQEAHKNKILLVKKQSLLETYIQTLDTHARRLSWALHKIKRLTPISSEEIASLDDEHVAFLELLYSRFCKMQDEIGSKVFPEILKYTDIKAVSFIDKINTMEKLEFLSDANWWAELRDLRNTLTHEYENNHKAHAENTNELVLRAEELLNYWYILREKLTLLSL